MGHHQPRFTREIAMPNGDKIAVKIVPEDNGNVVIMDTTLAYAATLDPRAAGQLGQAITQAARIAALNTLNAAPAQTTES